MLLCGEQCLVIARRVGEKRCSVVARRRLDTVEKMAKKKDRANTVTLLFSEGEGAKSQWKIEAEDVMEMCNEISNALALLD